MAANGDARRLAQDRSGTLRVRRRPMAHHQPLETHHRATTPLARRRTPLQRIGLVHARRRPRHTPGRLRLRRSSPASVTLTDAPSARRTREHASRLRVRLRRTLIAFSAEPGEAVQCSPGGPSGCEPRSGALDRPRPAQLRPVDEPDIGLVYDLMGVCPVVSRPCRGRRPGGRQPVGAGGPQAAARPARAKRAT